MRCTKPASSVLDGSPTDAVELDGWETHDFGALALTLVPARHRSMRMPYRNTTLWGGFVVCGPERTAFLGWTPWR